MRRAWILPALALACSRENPGFLVAGGGGGEVTTTGSSGTDLPSTTDNRTTGPGTTGEPLPLCPLWPEPALDLSFTYGGSPLTPPDDCETVAVYRGNGKLSTNTLTLSDDSTCGENLSGEFVVKLGYVAIDFLIITGCFEVQVEWNADCSAVRSALLLSYLPLFPNDKRWFAAGVVGSALPPSGAPPELKPTLMLADACSCDAGADDCCASAEVPGPGSYRLNFEAAGVTLGPGDSALFDIGDASYELVDLRSHVHADCVDAPLHLDWYAVRKK